MASAHRGFRLRPEALGVLHEVLEIVARTKRIARGMPKRNTYLVVFRCVLKELRHREIHARIRRVLLVWAIQLDPQDVSRAFLR